MRNMKELVDIIFLKNPDNLPVEFTLPSLETPFDLFIFCLNLTISGLLVLLGMEGSSVEINSVPTEIIHMVALKLENAGIELTVNIHPSRHINSNHMETIKRGPGNRVEDYALVLSSGGFTYVLTFVLRIRAPKIPPCLLL